MLEVAPVNWQRTLEQEDAQRRRGGSLYHQVALGEIT